MKIALIGEYSRLHNSLKEGLQLLEQEVTLIANQDSFKNYPSDFNFEPKITEKNFLFKNINKITRKLLKIDLQKIERGIRFYLILPKIKDFDVVQFINSNAIETFPIWSRFFIRKIKNQNKQLALIHCGDETPIISYLLQNQMKYSILTPLLNKEIEEKDYPYALKYISKPYKALYHCISQHASTSISCDLDYKIPLDQLKIRNQFIPNPINTDKISTTYSQNDKTIIFLGINTNSKIKKGIPFFEKALAIISQKYNEKVEIIITENVPYQEYIQSYNKAHILLDQIYAYDQGYNALEAMAKGKVVFTGAEQEFLDFYGLQEDEVCINALPDVDYLVEKLSFLIENPDEIKAIGERARKFIEKEHHYVKIAQKYIDTWNVR
ncbi:MAG: glycosyltransferase [Flavobacteriaceae bacterium]|jgi:glycosyltransferase involved in cell wall biosynthesis|nr:glycosyltransferase [Flavobacteriaceae bacterium]